MKLLITGIMIIGALLSSCAWAERSDPLQTIQKKWAECQYSSKDEDNQIFCLENLVKRAERETQANPARPDLKIWLAISKSSLAGADGGMGALSLVKEAKKILENVIHEAPETMNGSAYTSLGSLYYKVPGWPLGFGDDDKAREYLLKAIEINPEGIDPNYFYGDFLAEDGDKAQAIHYLTKALQAPARPGRQLADQGRKAEIKQRLKDLGVK